mmetsp:Transcript_108797/g.177590  ORF Transcript_108797/g.177590 Transcript_108797/m.177590 type:complete len:85 (-) Transcript_108797:13-267(-)
MMFHIVMSPWSALLATYIKNGDLITHQIPLKPSTLLGDEWEFLGVPPFTQLHRIVGNAGHPYERNHASRHHFSSFQKARHHRRT